MSNMRGPSIVTKRTSEHPVSAKRRRLDRTEVADALAGSDGDIFAGSDVYDIDCVAAYDENGSSSSDEDNNAQPEEEFIDQRVSNNNRQQVPPPPPSPRQPQDPTRAGSTTQWGTDCSSMK